ncbi:MAG: magnesium transporter [Hyphomonadaceae bacterium]|jgi:magnesium transporter|nr:magnesium transporter [Hyphomonadaceae bacterium]
MNDETDTAAEQTRAVPSEDAGFIVRIIASAGDHDWPALRRQLADLDPADLADVMEHVPLETARTIARMVGRHLPVEFLAELDWERREEILPELPSDYVGRALGELDTDDAAAVAADIDEEQLGEVLAAADEDTRLAVEEALSFEEETAGRLMQREYVAAHEGDTVGGVIDRMRDQADELPDEFFEIYIVDAAMRPIGAVRVSSLIRARRETPLRDIMRAPLILIRPEMDQEEMAQTFQKYHMASAPVVDGAGRITGMVTVDDIVDVISEESEEDLLKLAGVSEAAQTDSVAKSVRSRAPWLFVNLGTAIVASTVISAFQTSITELVALAVLMPIVASMGGNAGTQALAVAVRAIAARDLTESSAPRYILREAMTAISNGLIFAVLLAGVVMLWFHNVLLAVSIACAVLITFACAGLAGILVPLTLRRAGADPAVSSSVFVTFVTDIVGFLAFLGLATLILLR